MAAAMKTESCSVNHRVCATLDVVDYPANEHPLHLFVTRNTAKALGVPSDVSQFYLSLWTNTRLSESTVQAHPPGQTSIFQRMLSNSQNFPEILNPESEEEKDGETVNRYVQGIDVEVFTVVRVSDTESPDEVSEYILLRCSKMFMPHYNINSILLFVRTVNVFPVSNVVIGVSSHETYQWMTKKDFCKRLLTEVKSNSVLVRSKDVFLSQYGAFLDDPDFKRIFYLDMYVLECSPVQQGLITPSTELVITYLGDLEKEKEVFREKLESLTSCSGRGPRQISGPFKDQFISDFTKVLTRPNEQAFKGKSDNTKVRKIIGSFEFEIVPQLSVFKRMLWRDQKVPNFDPMYFVGMSRKHMIKEGLFDSSYVLLSPECTDIDFDEDLTEDKRIPKERLCMVKCLGKEYDKSRKLFVTPLCIFNMIKKPPIDIPVMLKMKKHDLEEESGFSTTKSKSWDQSPPIAREVQISIVPSPNYSPRAPHEEALKHYFSCPRVVAWSDVLAIRSADDPQFWQNTGDDTENRFPCIFFKVVDITGPQTFHRNFVMDRDNTRLIQIGTEHSYIPATMQTFLAIKPLGFWDGTYLPGLTKYLDELENYIMPHLVNKQGNKVLQSVPPAILVSGQVGSGKTTLAVAVARRLGVHGYKINCHTLVGESAGATESKMLNAFNAAALYSPCIVLLQSIHALGKDRDGNSDDSRVASSFFTNVMQMRNELQTYPMVVVATTHSNKLLTHDILECFLHEIKIESPTETDRGEMIDAMLQSVHSSGNIAIPYIAQRTAGFVMGDLAALVAHAKREAFSRIVKLYCRGRIRPTLQEEEDLLSSGIVLQQTDFQSALDELQAAHSDAIGAPKIPNVTWDDVGGLVNVKREIMDTIQLPLQYPELLAAGLRRSGVLLYGPPGTGKTLLAKAVATECSLNFLSVKGPELINMYVGQSEQNIREVFQRARSASPCVIFFDELDSLAPNRGKSGDSGGVMDRVVSQLLAELDGMNKSSEVFVIGATNRPDLLDPALLRPGRFDKMLYLGVSEDNQSQCRILSALTRKFNLSEDFNMETFVEKCPFTLTGADFYALASDAMLNALKRKIKLLDAGETVDQKVVVEGKDFFEALDKLSPSVTEAELERYKLIRDQFNVNNVKSSSPVS